MSHFAIREWSERGTDYSLPSVTSGDEAERSLALGVYDEKVIEIIGELKLAPTPKIEFDQFLSDLLRNIKQERSYGTDSCPILLCGDGVIQVLVKQ